MLTYQTIGKLLRQSFPGTAPMVADPAGPEALLDQVRAHVLGFPGVRDVTGRHTAANRGPSLEMEIPDPGATRGYWGDLTLRFSIDAEQRLILTYDQGKYPVSSLDEIDRFVRAYHAALQRRRAQQAKREKLRQLKSTAIVAQVRQIAREDGFDFYTETDTVKLKLHIRLDGDECILVPIPFSRFQEILPHLRASITAVRGLYATGIRFRLARVSRRTPWVDHRTLTED